jgi:ABC-type sugar transport system permease subunit
MPMTVATPTVSKPAVPTIADGRDAVEVSQRTPGAGRPAWNENLTAYIFILPAFVIIGLFGIFPIFYAIYMSLYRYRGPRQAEFVGLKNYVDVFGDWGGLLLTVFGFVLLVLVYLVWDRHATRMKMARRTPSLWRWPLLLAALLVVAGIVSVGWNAMMGSGDKDFLNGLIYTVYYALGSVPLQLGLGLVLAYVLFQSIWGKELWRMIFFLPYVTPAVAAAVVFRIVFSPRPTSLANQFVGVLGFEPQRWIGEPQPFLNAMFGLNLEGFIAGPSMALVTIIILGIWTYTGYNAVIFLAGLGSIPKDLYEAAKVDGANDWHLFRFITLPLLSPVTFYLSVLAFIGTFQAFNTIYVMRDPFAQGTTDTASVVIFDTFYKSSSYGAATAMALLLFLVILAMTLFQRNVLEKKVFYG